MAEINKISCVTVGANVGFGDCVFNPLNIVGAFLVPKDFKITPANALALQTFLITEAANPDANARIFPIHGFEQVTSNSESKTIQTLGYGGKAVAREGDYDWMFQFLNGGLCLLKSLRAFNGVGKSVLFYDAAGVLFGWKVGDDLLGVPLVFFWADPWTPNDGSNATIYTCQFVFKPRYINEQIGFLQADFPMETVEGLQTVALKELVGSARPVLKVGASVGCSGESLFDTYSAEIANVLAWDAKIGGSDIAITSVAVDTNLGGWTVTIDVADPDYVAGSPLVLKLAAVDVLAGLGVSGYESTRLTIAGV
jgi:hypothetical protein